MFLHKKTIENYARFLPVTLNLSKWLWVKIMTQPLVISNLCKNYVLHDKNMNLTWLHSLTDRRTDIWIKWTRCFLYTPKISEIWTFNYAYYKTAHLLNIYLCALDQESINPTSSKDWGRQKGQHFSYVFCLKFWRNVAHVLVQF